MPLTVAVIGGGLVGCLQAYYLTLRGHKVVLLEKRSDLRKDDSAAGRSINLALSLRGRAALRHVGLEEAVLAAGVPVYGRMVHSLDGSTHAMPYGVLKEQHNYAIDRRRLNCLLLDSVEKKGVKVIFDQRLVSAVFGETSVSLTFANSKGEETTHDEFEFIFGCDGAYSALRGRVIESSCTNFQIKYIEHGYRELFIAAKSNGEPALALNYLHLWARDEFMLMGLPNPDSSFTGTLFMPMRLFDTINSAEKLVSFFEKNFPDAVPLLGGRAGLLEQYKVTKARPGKLPSIRLNPYHAAEGRVLFMGDAAHGMVPFYAQGMNSGFEDCQVLDEAIEEELRRSGESSVTKDVMQRAVVAYSTRRAIDGAAVCDLAEYNYIEMRHLVNVWWFRWRKAFDYWLYRLLGCSGSWVPLYIAVSYTRMPYDACRRHKAWQDSVLRRARIAGFVALGAVAAGFYFWPSLRRGGQIRWSDLRIFN